MKRYINNRCLISALTLLIMTISGCSDNFLDRPPKDQVVDANFYRTDDEVLAGTALLYNLVWFDYNDKASFAIGDFRGGTMYSTYNYGEHIRFNVTANTEHNYTTWRAFFNVIGQSNTAIVNINRYAGEAVSERIKKHAIAEARFMRATAYRYLVMNYGPVPIITNNFTIVGDTTTSRNTIKSVWEFITREYKAAAQDLTESPVQTGRITKWAAEGMLARTYLTRAGVGEGDMFGSNSGVRDQVFLDSAKYYAERVITLSGAKLLDNYADLFKYPYDNNIESLFSLQWIFVGGVGYNLTSQTLSSSLGYSPSIANGDGWGGDFSATWWMLKKYEGIDVPRENGDPVNKNGIEDTLQGGTIDTRLKATFMLPGAHYPEITQTLPDNSEQQLRFPYDDEATISNASPKKYVMGKSKDNGGKSANHVYDNDTYMLRLAEMYLIYANAELGNQASTADVKALEYFNKVHERATKQKLSGPLTWQVLFDEKLKEFALESMSWYDLVELHYYKKNLAYQIIKEQYRAPFYIKPDKLPDPNSWTFIKTPWFDESTGYFEANDGNFRLPIPATEATMAPNLAKAPVDYYSGN